MQPVQKINLTVCSIGKEFPIRFPQKESNVMSFFEMTSVASLSVGDVFTKIAGLIYLLT